MAYPPEELARLAGTSLERVLRMIELGILSPGPDGHPTSEIQRVRIVDAFDAAGISPEILGRLVAEGRYSMSWFDLLYPEPIPLSERTFAEACAANDVPLDLASRIFVSGFQLPAPEPDEPMRADEEEMLELLAIAFRMLGRDPEALHAGVRYFGDNLRRMTESQVAFFRANVEEPLFAALPSNSQAIDALVGFAAPMLQVGDRAVSLLYRRHLEHYSTEDIVANLERVVEEAGIARPRPAHPTAIAFADLSGSTAFAERHGDEATARMGEQLGEVARESAARHEGRPVKLLGDGVMLRFEAAEGAARCGLEMVDAVPRGGLPQIRVGISTGSVVFRDGDYYGRTVILASRIADRIGPHEVVLTGEAAAAVEASDLAMEPMGATELKGVADPVELFRARRL